MNQFLWKVDSGEKGDWVGARAPITSTCVRPCIMGLTCEIRQGYLGPDTRFIIKTHILEEEETRRKNENKGGFRCG